jgi:tetratricopeptide (TPR) repeat protein
MQTTPISTASRLLSGIDYGAFESALRFCESHEPQRDDAADTLLRAEVDLYLDRLEDARTRLDALEALDDWIDTSGELGELGRRWRLMAAEHAYLTGAYQEADTLARPVVTIARRLGDGAALLRALYTLARISREQGDAELAVERLEKVVEMAREVDNTLYQGRAAFTTGVCWYACDRRDLTVSFAREAATLLRHTEATRFQATVEMYLGGLLCDEGRLPEALELVERAERAVSRLCLVSDMMRARVTTARTLLALERFEEAAQSLSVMLNWQRGPVWNQGLELFTLRLLSIAYYHLRRTTEAIAAAREAVALADVAGTPRDRLEGRILHARARAQARDTGAADDLDRLVAEADVVGSEYLRAESRIYLAEALLGSDPTRAAALSGEVKPMRVVGEVYWLRFELGRVESSLANLPIHTTREGKLLMDPTLGWPDLKAAREQMERFWLERALQATDGNVLAAGQLLGLSRNEAYHVHALVIRRKMPRPSRGKNPTSTAHAVRRRQRSS